MRSESRTFLYAAALHNTRCGIQTDMTSPCLFKRYGKIVWMSSGFSLCVSYAVL